MSLRILVVDDDPDVVGTIGAILGRAGHRIIAAYDGAEALRRVRADDPDVILLDLVLPDLDGGVTFREIRGVTDRPVIIVSGERDVSVAVEFLEGKPNPGMMVNGMLAGLVAITAPSGFVGPIAAAIEKVMRVDDPVGAIAVHGVNGLWGVLATGIFADGTANYGGFQVTGLLYGNVGQFAAQVIGGVVAFVWAFGASYIFFKILDRFVKLRVSPADEIAGLDIPEMGLAAYVPDDLPVPAYEPRAAARGAEPALGSA